MRPLEDGFGRRLLVVPNALDGAAGMAALLLAGSLATLWRSAAPLALLLRVRAKWSATKSLVTDFVKTSCGFCSGRSWACTVDLILSLV